VVEADANADGIVTLSYNYTIGGVDYQSFQHLDAEQLSRKHDYFPAPEFKCAMTRNVRELSCGLGESVVSSQLSVGWYIQWDTD